MGAPVDPSDAVYFPYAVVEIKMQAEPPEWVQELLDTGAGSGTAMALVLPLRMMVGCGAQPAAQWQHV